MSMFDEETENEWIKVVDEKSTLTIEDFPYQTGVQKEEINGHCWKCITINKCWFKNEENKKPEEHGYSFDFIQRILETFGLDIELGIYHPNCHCKKREIINPTPDKIELIIPEGKVDWLFINKMHMLKTFGYVETEKKEILSIFSHLCKESYANGNYILSQHNHYGFKITLYISFPGKRKKHGKNYKLETSWMIFPDGKLKCNTLIGGLIQ